MDIDFLLGMTGLVVFLGSVICLPATYGALLRQDADADWKKLPRLLKFAYFGEVDLNKRGDERGWLSKRPEIVSLGLVVVFSGSLVWELLLGMLEINEQTGELQIDTTGVGENAFVIVLLIFWSVAITFGTELWLKRKWLPKHAIRDKTPSQELVDRNARSS